MPVAALPCDTFCPPNEARLGKAFVYDPVVRFEICAPFDKSASEIARSLAPPLGAFCIMFFRASLDWPVIDWMAGALALAKALGSPDASFP